MHRRSLLARLAALPLSAAAARVVNAAPRRNIAALSVGISSYAHGPALPSANRDSRLMAATFLQLGYETEHISDPSHQEFLLSLARLRVRAEAAWTVVIYVAAHGLMRGGESVIFPRDADFANAPLSQAVPETVLLRAVSDKPRQKVLFLDTCREVPGFSGCPAGDCGVYAPGFLAGTHVSYATQPGAGSLDGGDGYSPFARGLRETLTVPGLDLAEVSRRVRSDVIRATSGLQVPWDRSSLLEPIVLNATG